MMATPSLNLFHGLLLNSAGDLTSVAYSQSEGQSQTPGGSTTNRRQQHSADNPRQTNPTSLSYYQGTEVYEALIFARNAFTATAFSSGYFFYCQSLRCPRPLLMMQLHRELKNTKVRALISIT